MNAQRFIAGLRVCTMAEHPVPGRLLSKSCIVSAAFFLASATCAVSVCADEYDIIIEKNLFHDQRQKWEMENSPVKGSSSQSGPRENQNIDQINLFGTVVKDSHSYAIMRMTQPPAQLASRRRASRRGNKATEDDTSQDSKRPYTIGDFISGYQVVEIKPESVLLQDSYDNKQYRIFMNDSQTERTAVRTEIVPDTPEPPPQTSAADKKSPSRASAKSPPLDPSASADFIRQRFEKDLEAMRTRKDDAEQQRADGDEEGLQSIPPSLDEKGQEELERLKREFEKMRQ
jgi:hypothetical protein